MQTVNTLGLARDNISNALVAALRRMILDGQLAAGQRINEVRLASALGVSRTPLREALARLAHEGALSSLPNIGYSVRPLTIEEFDQLYEIRPLLDPEALRLAGLPSPQRLEHLDQLNTRIARARQAELMIALDDEWHLSLIESCPNRILVELIEQISRRTRRYEMALMSERKNALGAAFEHRAILSALKRRDLPAACAALRKNLQTGKAPILSWLAERQDGAAPPSS